VYILPANWQDRSGIKFFTAMMTGEDIHSITFQHI
jgi:hypothetical protein